MSGFPGERPGAAGAAGAGAGSAATTILIVEDNDANLDVMTRALRREGFSVLTALDARRGLELARASRPDLIVMDLSLPDLDGWEAARRLKADGATAAIPIIAVTAHAMAEDRRTALEAGCDAYASKPVDFPKLIGRIRGLLEKR